MSCGAILASTMRASASGTISMIGSPASIDAADGVDRELVDRAVLRRPDVDALQLVLGGDLASRRVRTILARISAKLLADLAAQVLVDLQDLQLGLGDLALGLGDGGDKLRRARLRAAPRRARAR